ncbi:hypothetical protein AAG906_030736 [Vitis piasezkii]
MNRYMLFWKMIDEIWNNHPYGALNAAANHLNLRIFYSREYCFDKEVFEGINCCVWSQLDQYLILGWEEPWTEEMIFIQSFTWYCNTLDLYQDVEMGPVVDMKKVKKYERGETDFCLDSVMEMMIEQC